MHSESWSAFCGFPVWIAKFERCPLGPDPVEGAPPLSGVPPSPLAVDEDEEEDEWLLEVVEVLTLATPGLLPPPPQPPTSRPTATSATATIGARRRQRGSRCLVTVTAGGMGWLRPFGVGELRPQWIARPW
jgi:hypothetical protein